MVRSFLVLAFLLASVSSFVQDQHHHPLEVIQAATKNPALTLFEPKSKESKFGVVREGLLADLVGVD